MAKYSFTYHQEIGHQGQSLVPHFPGGKSGVTIGPGYDMGHRSPQEIYADLTAAGIDPETAYLLIDAAHKTGPDARDWVGQTGGIFITEQQQQALFENVLVPEYEERAKNQLLDFISGHPGEVPADLTWESLSGRQREVLFDYVYNTGGLSGFSTLTTAVLNDDWDTAALHYERFSGDQPLAYRNDMFFQTFLDPAHPYEEEILADSYEAQITSEDLLADEITDLYQEDTEESATTESDEWFEHT